MLTAFLLSAIPQASVDLSLTPPQTCAVSGSILQVELVLATDLPTAIAAVDAIICWDPLQLGFLGAVPSAAGWLTTGFLNDPDGINTDIFDGEALFTALASPVTPPSLPPDLLVATFNFQVLASGDVSLLASSGLLGETRVLGTIPGQDLTGSLIGPAAVTVIVPQASAEVSRTGTPPNPDVFLPGQTSGPVVGQTWDPRVDHTSFLPGAVLDGFFVSKNPAEVPLPPFGLLLCNPSEITLTLTGPPGPAFQVPIPLNCAFVGVQRCTQAFSVDAGGTVLLTNALDVTIGSF